MNPVENPYLETISKLPSGLKKDKRKRFTHKTLAYFPSAKVFFEWKWGKKEKKKIKKKDSYTLPYSSPETFFNSKQDGIVWLWHASFYIRLNGANIITDPVFYKLPFIKNISHHPKNPLLVMKDLDYLVISHDHRDHLDVRTLKKLTHIFPNVRCFTGMNMKSLLRKFHFKEIQCASWYQKYNISKDISLYFLPAKHRWKRGIFDTNKRLWGSFIIKTKNTCIYFWWDSWYDSHFKEIGKLFPKIDYALIGIGAYEPKLFSKNNHTSPEEAIQAAKDLWATYIIPMHYGTFDITNEAPSEPLNRFSEAMKQETELKAIILDLWGQIAI